MKILFINTGIHHKNHNFLRKCKKIESLLIPNSSYLKLFDLSKFDAVYSPSEIFDISEYSDTKFIFGPHCCIFPHEKNLNLITFKNSIYIQPSQWVVELWNKSNAKPTDLKISSFSFGVDTDRFSPIKPIKQRNLVFIYHKGRNPDDLEVVKNFLQNKSINYKIFSYNHRYDENEYLNFLREAKYGIWVGAHESQGFALQESLSCNVPLLVWNITSMNQEYGINYEDNPATSIPYWNESCGEYFYNKEDLENTFNKFISKIESYKPREFILNNLSIEVCERKLIELIDKL